MLKDSCIKNNNINEDDNTLNKKEIDISAVRKTGRTKNKNNTESAGDFLLAREAVVRFVQDSIAPTVDRQKRISDKNEKQTYFHLMWTTCPTVYGKSTRTCIDECGQ